MLDKNDVKVIQTLLESALEKNNRLLRKEMRQEIDESIGENNTIIRQEIRQVVDESIRQNNRVMQDFVRHEVRTEIRKVKEEIIEGVAQLLDTSIHPQLDDHDKRLAKLEQAAAL